jgi:hypothetical protein
MIIGPVYELSVSSKQVSEFYNKTWNRKIALGYLPFYKWQFCLPPENKGNDSCCIAVDDNGEILGVMGLNNRGFYLNGILKNAAELTTWVVSEKDRGKGVGRGIIQYLQQNYDVLLGIGCADAALPIYMTSGFRFLKYIPRFVRVYNSEKISKFTESNFLADRLIKKWSEIKKSSYEVNKVMPSILSTYERYLTKDFNCFKRDSQFLSWRYDNHPIFKYNGFLVKSEGEGVGIVLRIDKIDEVKIAHVIDFFGDNRDFYGGLNFIDDYCYQNDVSVADFYCPSTKITKYFLNSGWFSTLDDSFFRFIHLFHPPELREPPTTSLIFWSKENMLALLDTSKLYITKQDIDFDRPTAAY